jgi:hypothetical protein
VRLVRLGLPLSRATVQKESMMRAKLATLIRNNWKGAVVGAAVMGATAFGGPIAGKVVAVLAPKALQHVSDTPISAIKDRESPFSREAITHEPKEVTLRITARERAMLAEVAGDWGIEGRLRCAVVPKN